jgi:hypothetical protein
VQLALEQLQHAASSRPAVLTLVQA